MFGSKKGFWPQVHEEHRENSNMNERTIKDGLLQNAEIISLNPTFVNLSIGVF